jgi:hypothetical protein
MAGYSETTSTGRFTLENSSILPATDAAVSGWMRTQGWSVPAAHWHMDPDGGFHIWQEEPKALGRSHALWVVETMVRRLDPEELVQVLNRERVAEAIRVSFRVRIEERGAEYRVSVVPRKSGEVRRPE